MASERKRAEKEVKKIVFVSNEAARTGAPAIVLGLIHWLQRHHHLEIVNVLMRDGALRSDFEQTGTTYTWVPTDLNQPERIYKRLSKLLLQRNQSDPGVWLTAILEKEKPDIIYLSTLVLGKYLQQVKKLPHQHIVSHGHELLPSLRQLSSDQFVQIQLALSDEVIACAPCVAETLTNSFHLSARKCRIIPEYIVPETDPESAHTSGRQSSGLPQQRTEQATAMLAAELGEARQKLEEAIRQGAFIFGIGGNPISRKGIDLFPLLVQECKRQFADLPFHAVWIGCGEGSAARVSLEWDLQRMGLEDCVSLLPSVSMPTFRWVLSRFHVLTLLSREDPFPLVVLEAGLLGVPTVCFAGSGAIPEMAAAGRCVSVNYLDLPAYAAAVRHLCLNPQEAQAIAARCQRHVADALSLDVVAPRVAEVLLRPKPSAAAGQSAC
jgi:glycosyltransferase involved in cell wall biosynthesis